MGQVETAHGAETARNSTIIPGSNGNTANSWFIIKPGLPEGRSDQGGRAVELDGG